MPLRLLPVLIACVGPASAAAEYDVVISCLAATDAALGREPSFDRFVRSGEPTDASILRWEEAFSEADARVVSTVVEIDGRARRRTGAPDTWDEVRVRCGLNDAKVEIVEIVPAAGRES